MKKKAAESEFGALARRHGMWAFKFKDVMQCPYCHRKLWDYVKMPDFLAVWRDIAFLVEAKQASKYWKFADLEAGLRPNQRETMDEWQANRSPCWLFLELGAGRAPNGRSAWLVPYPNWLETEAHLLEWGQKSLARETKGNIGALDLLWPYELEWVPGSKKAETEGGWIIQNDHIFWEVMGGWYANTDRHARQGDRPAQVGDRGLSGGCRGLCTVAEAGSTGGAG